MECKRDGCHNELRGRQRDFCSGRCCKAQNRANRTSGDGSGSTNADKAGQIHPPERGQIEVKPEQVSDLAERGQTMHDRQCQANNQTRAKADQHTINTGPPKSFDELDTGEHNRVSLPGDVDYEGCVQPEFAGPALQMAAAGMVGPSGRVDPNRPRERLSEYFE